MKHIRLAVLIQVVFLCFNIAQAKDLNIQIEYRQEIKNGYFHNCLVEYFYFDSELDQKINYRIQSALNYFYSVDLSELAHEANKTYNHFNVFKQDLGMYELDSLHLQYGRFINQLNGHQVGEIIKYQSITKTKQSIDNWSGYDLCIDSVCFPTLKFSKSIESSYEIVEDSILIFNLWRINSHDTSKYNLIVNLNTGKNLSFYDLFQAEGIPEVKEVLEYDFRKPWASEELFSGGEFVGYNGLGWFAHFCLLPEEKELIVYGQHVNVVRGDVPSGLFDFNLHSEQLNINMWPRGLTLAEVGNYLNPWVKRYLEGK